MHARPVIVAFLLLFTALSSGCSDGGPEARAKAFIEASASGDVDRVLGFMHPEDREEFDALEGSVRESADERLEMRVREAKRRADANDGIESIEIIEVDERGDSATIKLKATFGNGKTEDIKIKLDKIDGEWYPDM